MDNIDDLVPPSTDWLPDEPMTLGERQAIYLEGIRAGLNYTEAAAMARVDRSTAFRWRQDPAFTRRVNEARAVCIDGLVREAERRAMRGSDKLLEFLLVNYAPERFQRATQKVDLNANVRSQVSIISEFEAEHDASDLI